MKEKIHQEGRSIYEKSPTFLDAGRRGLCGLRQRNPAAGDEKKGRIIQYNRKLLCHFVDTRKYLIKVLLGKIPQGLATSPGVNLKYISAEGTTIC